jgi:hypothetical protein
MARSWSGFVPQNQQALEQWGVLEASSQQIIEVLLSLSQRPDAEGAEARDISDLLAGWPYDDTE